MTKSGNISTRTGWIATAAALRFRLLVVGPGLTPIHATAQDGGPAAVNLALVIGTLVLAGLSAFLLLKVRNLSRAISERGEEAAVLESERDEAREALAEKSKELEVELGKQIRELENENEALSEATAKLRKLVVVDEMTGLANRMHFDQVLPHEIKRALREEKALSVILARFDWADAFRESYGDERYHEALARISSEVRGIFRRAGDLPARYSKDCFGIIFTSDGDVAVRFAERLRKSIWGIPIAHESSQTADRVTISVGVATILPNKVHDPEDLRRAAENAMRAAESGGGNVVEEYRKPPRQPAAV